MHVHTFLTSSHVVVIPLPPPPPLPPSSLVILDAGLSGAGRSGAQL